MSWLDDVLWNEHELVPAIAQDAASGRLLTLAWMNRDALEHLVEGIQIGGADAVLAASIFHYGEFTVAQAKALMARDGIPVRQ